MKAQKVQIDEGWLLLIGALIALAFVLLCANAFGPPPDNVPWLQ